MLRMKDLNHSSKNKEKACSSEHANESRWWPNAGSNCGHQHFQCCALPAELSGQIALKSFVILSNITNSFKGIFFMFSNPLIFFDESFVILPLISNEFCSDTCRKHSKNVSIKFSIKTQKIAKNPNIYSKNNYLYQRGSSLEMISIHQNISKMF